MKYMCLMVLLATSALAAKDPVEGVLVFEYGDALTTTKQAYQRFYLQTEDALIELNASAAFKQQMPIHLWAGKRVAVQFKPHKTATDDIRTLQAIELVEGEASRGGISGAQKWVSFLCKFNDIAAEPEDEAFFDDMYANSPAGLDHYWREVSYNTANVAGSIAFDWLDLPSDQATYVANPGGGTDADLNLLFDDCTDVAINTYGSLDINDGFVGINMMFNDSLDCCAWGGGRYTSLDGGPTKLWRVTWNPPWAFGNEGVIAHEMGHGMGLPHANNSDGDGDPYDSPWDVMSSATGYGVLDSVYGRLGKHINMEYKHNLGWVDDADGFIANTMSDDLFLMVYSSRPQIGSGYRFAKIPLSDGTHYMVEVRKEIGNYESNIPGTAVIIHHVDQNRSEPPWVVDQDVPPANYSDNEGVMWKTGEIFVDPIDGFQVEVKGLFTAGYNVKIIGPDQVIDLIYEDGFE